MPHLTLDVYLMILQGQLPPRTLVDIGFTHLLEICGPCYENWEEYRQMPLRRSPSQPLPAASVASAYGAPARELELRREKVRETRRQARRDLRDLLALPVEERDQRVRNARTRFRSREQHTFGERLLSAMRFKFGGHTEPAAGARACSGCG